MNGQTNKENKIKHLQTLKDLQVLDVDEQPHRVYILVSIDVIVISF